MSVTSHLSSLLLFTFPNSSFSFTVNNQHKLVFNSIHKSKWNRQPSLFSHLIDVEKESDSPDNHNINSDQRIIKIQSKNNNRRSFLEDATRQAILPLLFATTTTSANFPAQALVKGNAPPPKKSPSSSSSSTSEEKKCRNVEECQEMAERLEAARMEEARASMIPASVAPGGSRYRDLEETEVAAAGGTASLSSDSRLVKEGDEVSIRYKVLKLGKRSYDGLTGEGTVVFSRGYGLEDDEDKAGVKTFSFALGNPSVISALSDAIPGMKVGGIRRIAVLPQMGWERPERACDGGPGGRGAGGDIKTDYVIVPTATMVATESCLDKSKLPFPTSYAEQRRMAQRFDQSLIIEVELVSIDSK